MKWLHNLPLVLFTVSMPAIVFGYFFNYTGGGYFILALIIASVLTLALASVHLGQPVGAALALRHVRRSWLSREMILFMLFLAGLVLHLLFPALSVSWWAVLMLVIGLLGVISTIMVYHTSPRVGQWSVFLDFLLDGLIFGALIGQSSLFPVLILLKAGKDFIFSILLYWRKAEVFWLLPAFLAVVIVSMKSIVLDIWIGVVALLITLVLRFEFFKRIDCPMLEQSAAELRNSYMPGKYQKYFTSRKY